jgi:glycosyltransferase involved in cell wall biosynthesis
MSFDLIHVHNIPDFLAFAAWYPKLTGAKLILDIHDVVPELFASKFGVDDRSLYVRLLKKVEKASAAFVDHVIVANHLWHKKLIARSVPEEKSSVFLNHVDPAVFYRHSRTRTDGKFIILFPGTFQWHQGLDIAIDALAHIKDKVPNAELHLYGGGGSGDTEVELADQAKRLGLNGRVKFCGGVPFDKIADVIANADLGVVPKRANSFGNEAYSTKIMEFMSQGVPAVISKTKIDSYYFDDTVVRFFPSGDSQAMAAAMMDVIENEELRQKLVKNGLEYAARYNWDCVKDDYLTLVDSLTTENFEGSKLAVAAKAVD